MDRKSIIILVASFILLMAWYPLVVNKLYPPKPLPKTLSVTNGAPATNIVTSAATSAPSSLVPSSNAPSLAEEPSLAAATAVTGTNAQEQLLEVTNANAHYTFTSIGGGLKEIELLGYPEAVSRKDKRAATRRVATLNSPAPVAAFAFSGPLQGDGIYSLSHIENGVRAQKTLTNGLTIVKDFQLGTNYLVEATVRILNRSSNAVLLPEQDLIVGTATPLSAQDPGTAVGALWYNGAKTEDIGASFFSSTRMGCVPRVPPAEFRGGSSNVAWVAIHNQFFTLAAMPEQPAQQVVVQKVNLPRAHATDVPVSANSAPPAGYIAAMIYPAATLAPNATVERRIHIFAGPKEYQTLAKLGNRFQNNIDLVMGFGGFFGFFAKGLLLAMNWLHEVVRFSYGWAIIVITIIIKIVFWPLTQASTRSMKRLQALQPQMKAIQEKYKDDPAKMNRKTMEFMKEHKVSPLGGCLPMLLQIPVFFGFYQMIQSAIELRGASWFWVNDLSKPDTLFFIPGTAFPVNLLPLLMGATMLWQAKLTPPSPGMDPAQAKIMRYMPLMFMVFLYNFSAGLTLYWTVQNLLTIAQTKLTKTLDPGTPGAAPAALTPAPKKRK